MHLISNVDHFRCSNIDVSETKLVLWFLPVLRRFNPAEPVVEKSVILSRIKMSRAFPGINIKFWNKVRV